MKNLFLWLLFVLTLSACKKKSNNSNNTPTQPQVIYPNTVKLIDNGTTYTLTGYSSSNPAAANSPMLIDVYVDGSFKDDYRVNIQTYAVDTPPFKIDLNYFIAKDKLYSSNNVNSINPVQLNYVSSIYKNFSIDSGTVTITHYDPDKVTGEFQFYLDNGHEKRNVKGSFDINEPEL